jgi:hypothetical protein
METTLLREAALFGREREARACTGARRIALRLQFGLDLEDLDRLESTALQRLSLRMSRRLERERLKGANGHWSYDLNRHIALKSALDDVRARIGPVREAV